MKQVAPFLGISFDTVSLMEKGRLSIPVPRLILWCLCLGVDPGEVLKLALDDISEREIADG